MSRVLRGLGRLARQSMAESSEASSSKSLRNTHTETGGRYSPNQYSKNMPFDKSAQWVPKNPFIEAWVYRRDKYEREFSWNMRNSFELGYFVIGMSVAFYGFSVWTIRHSDARNHYPKRDMLLAETGNGFRLPDEREWY